MKKSEIAAAVCAFGFIAVLAVSAYLDRSIRVLHTVEALPYLAAAILILRHRKFGYALGLAAGGLWLAMAGLRTSFVAQGFRLLFAGKFDRPDILIAVPAALFTGGLALFSAVAYAGIANRSWRDAVDLAIAFAAVLGFFLLIFAEFAPQFLRIFGLS